MVTRSSPSLDSNADLKGGSLVFFLFETKNNAADLSFSAQKCEHAADQAALQSFRYTCKTVVLVAMNQQALAKESIRLLMMIFSFQTEKMYFCVLQMPLLRFFPRLAYVCVCAVCFSFNLV